MGWIGMLSLTEKAIFMKDHATPCVYIFSKYTEYKLQSKYHMFLAMILKE